MADVRALFGSSVVAISSPSLLSSEYEANNASPKLL